MFTWQPNESSCVGSVTGWHGDLLGSGMPLVMSKVMLDVLLQTNEILLIFSFALSYAWICQSFLIEGSSSQDLEAGGCPNQGVTQDLETGGQNWGFLKFRGSKVSYPIYKNDNSNLIYWLSKTKCASLCHLMYLLSSRSETFEIFPWTQTNTENLEKYNWVSFSQKSCVWESKWLPGGCLGKSLAQICSWNIFGILFFQGDHSILILLP